MKRIIFILLAMLPAFAGCKKGPSLSEQLCGEWRGSELTADAGIYLNFCNDGTFELYQKLDSDAFELRRGRYALTGDILSGTYNDGEAWMAAYKVSLAGDSLTLTAQNEGNETNVYRKTEIPAYIKESSTEVVKSRPLL